MTKERCPGSKMYMGDSAHGINIDVAKHLADIICPSCLETVRASYTSVRDVLHARRTYLIPEHRRRVSREDHPHASAGYAHGRLERVFGALCTDGIRRTARVHSEPDTFYTVSGSVSFRHTTIRGSVSNGACAVEDCYERDWSFAPYLYLPHGWLIPFEVACPIASGHTHLIEADERQIEEALVRMVCDRTEMPFEISIKDKELVVSPTRGDGHGRG